MEESATKGVPDDSELVLRVENPKNRNDPAFGQLYAKHNPKLYSLVLLITKNHHYTQDILQEVWSKFLAYVERNIDISSNFPAWIRVVARNCALDYLRKKGKEGQSTTITLYDDKQGYDGTQMETGEQNDVHMPEGLMTMMDPSKRAHWSMELERVEQYMKHLSDKVRVLIQLTAVGYSTKEIAARLSMGKGAVDVARHWARSKLGDMPE